MLTGQLQKRAALHFSMLSSLGQSLPGAASPLFRVPVCVPTTYFLVTKQLPKLALPKAATVSVSSTSGDLCRQLAAHRLIRRVSTSHLRVRLGSSGLLLRVCCHCSISSLLIVAILLCLICKLNLLKVCMGKTWHV